MQLVTLHERYTLEEHGLDAAFTLCAIVDGKEHQLHHYRRYTNLSQGGDRYLYQTAIGKEYTESSTGFMSPDGEVFFSTGLSKDQMLPFRPEPIANIVALGVNHYSNSWENHSYWYDEDSDDEAA